MTKNRIFDCKLGIFNGKSYIFSHRNPETGEVWSDDLPVYDSKGKIIEYGMWVPFESVKWVS